MRPGGVLVTVAGPTGAWRAIFLVVEPNREGLAALERRLVDGRLRPIVAAECSLDQAPSAFDPVRRGHGKTIFGITEGSV